MASTIENIKKIIEQNSEQDTDIYIKSSVPSVSVMIYVFVGGNGDTLSVDTCEEIEILKQYMTSFFMNPNYISINICPKDGKGEEAYQFFINSYCQKVKNRSLTHLDSWGIVPIFLPKDNSSAAIKEYKDFIGKLVKYAEDNLISYNHIPSILFEGNNATKNNPLMKELLAEKDHWHPSLPFLVIYPNTSLDYIEYTNRLNTIFIVSMLQQSTKPVFDHNMVDNPKCQCYAARLFTISKPYHIEILLRAKNLLEYFLRKPENSGEMLKRLAANLSSVPYESVWNRWSSLPCVEGNNNAYDRKKISILPVYSLVFPSDAGRDEVKAIFKPFVERYYYSQLPITSEIINGDIIRNKFFDKYKYGYGFYISAFDELFNSGKSRVFKERMLESIEIESFDKSSSLNNESFDELVEKLINELDNRTKRFYDIVFSDACIWYKKARENYKFLKNSLTDLLLAIDDKIKYWRGIEGDMTLPDDLWKDDDRKRIMNSFIEILKSDNPEDDFCDKLVSSIFSIAKEGITGNRISYMEAFDDHSKDDTVVLSWKRLLNVPQYRIVPNGQSSFQNIVICDTPGMLSENSLKRINGDITHFLYTDSGVKDRIDYIVLSRVGTWNGTMDEGES